MHVDLLCDRGYLKLSYDVESDRLNDSVSTVSYNPNLIRDNLDELMDDGCSVRSPSYDPNDAREGYRHMLDEGKRELCDKLIVAALTDNAYNIVGSVLNDEKVTDKNYVYCDNCVCIVYKLSQLEFCAGLNVIWLVQDLSMIEKCIDVVSKFERIEVYWRFERRVLLLCKYSNRTSYVGDLLQLVDDVLCEDFIDECKLDLIDKYLNDVEYTKKEFDDKVRKEVMHYMVCDKRILLTQSVDLVLSYLRRYT